MGFFRRLKISSSNASSSNVTQNGTDADSSSLSSYNNTTTTTTTTAATLPPSPSSTFFPSRLSTDQLARPNAIASPPSSLRSSKISHKPWKIGKGRKDDPIAGPSYESTRVVRGRSSMMDLREERTGMKDTAITLNNPMERDDSVPSVRATSWGRSHTSPQLSHDARENGGEGLAHRGDLTDNMTPEVFSGHFHQDGGILGRLGFEGDDSAVKSKGTLWIDTTPRRPTADHHEKSATEHAEVQTPRGDGPGILQSHVAERTSDELEILESAEKKQKFWKRPRRPSKAASDCDDEQPGSPTPRKAIVSASATDSKRPLPETPADNARPRPSSQLRRPSSSLFQNPFTRSVSRNSNPHGDVEVPISTADDASFQLKAFRHISGTSDVEGLGGGIQAYLPQAIQGSTTTADKSEVSSPIDIPSPSTASRPPSSFNPGSYRGSSQGQLARPPSVATSLASMDDIATSNKISAAAFRKGRRPSYGPATAVDAGQKDHDDDDDDVPLGMINRNKAMTRDQSALSLSSLADAPKISDSSQSLPHAQVPLADVLVANGVQQDTPESQAGRPARASPSPRPSPSSSRRSVHLPDKSSPSFVVRSRQSEARPSIDGKASYEGRPSLASEPNSQVKPPLLSPAAQVESHNDEKEIVESPTSVEEHPPFPFDNPRPAARPRQPSKSWFEVKDEGQVVPSAPVDQSLTPRAIEDQSELRVEAAPKPKVEEPLPSLDCLPLPPDLIPETPSARSPTSPGRRAPHVNLGRKRLSMLDEPLRVISGSGMASPEGTKRDLQDGFDPDLVISSMAVFASSPEDKKEIKRTDSPVDVPKPVPTSPSGSGPRTEITGSSPTGETAPRSPLSSRLAKAAMVSTTSARPTLSVSSSSSSLRDERRPTSWAMPNDAPVASLSQLIKEEKAREEMEKRPVDGSGKSSFASETPAPQKDVPVTSSFARARPVKPRSASATSNGKPAVDSSDSESDNEVSAKHQRKTIGQDRKHPGGPRNTSRPRVVSVAIETDSSSSEDESLAVLRARASMSSLSLHKVVSYTGSYKPSSPLVAAPSLPPSPAKTAQTALPRPRNVRSGSSTHSRPPVSSRRPSGQATPPRSDGPAAQRLASSKSPPKLVARLSSQTAGGADSAASSSQSATSESIVQPPMTPRDATSILKEPAALSVQTQWQSDEARARRHSQLPSSNYFDPQATPSGTGMDQAAMITMMKQQWQAQFMAAAYRASEEEWERASAISGTTPSQSPPFSPMTQLPQMGQMNMGYGMPMPPMPYGYPMGMPGMPMAPMPMPGMSMPGMAPMPLQGMPWYPPFSGSSSVYGGGSVHNGGGGGGGGGGMYNYGPGSQSVFGGEFGPPQRATFYSYPQQAPSHLQAPYPYQMEQQGGPRQYEQPASNAPPLQPERDQPRTNRNTLVDLAGQHGVGSGPAPKGGYKRPGGHGRTSSASSQPPSSWRVTTLGHAPTETQWDDAPTPRKARPATQVIN